MKPSLYRVLTILAATFAAALSSHAGPRTIGGLFSLNGAGIAYQHNLNEGRFYELRLGIAYGHSVFVERCAPGVTASYTYNIVFARKEYGEGTLRGYGGPGVLVSYGKDSFSSLTGLKGGLTGTVGLEFSFRLPVTLSIEISPCLGFMLSSYGGRNALDAYISGLTYGFLPIIGIRYDF